MSRSSRGTARRQQHASRGGDAQGSRDPFRAQCVARQSPVKAFSENESNRLTGWKQVNR
jgi:hypothetical protein